MSEVNKAVVQQLFDGVTSGNLDVFDKLLSDDFVEHEEMPGMPGGKEGVKSLFRMLRGSFPDLRMTASLIIAEGDLVSAFVTATGTHRGEFMGIPATGKSVSLNLTDWMRVQNGKVTEHWGVSDMGALMQQIGASH
jgi:steroid delta-isomerase-like uncharacterized protein